MKHLIFLLMVLTVIPTAAHGQDRDSLLMQYIIDDRGDTVYLDNIEPVVKTARRKGKEWRRYYRLVHNFAKAYPYALLAEEKLSEADSTITTDGLRRGKRNRYINILQKELFETFEKPLRNLTVSQGKLLLRLIDRQTGITPYAIINEYK